MALHTYIPQDRLRALARGQPLPDRTAGSALFADISGFTALTESLRDALGPRQGAEELTRHLSLVYSALIAEVEKHDGSGFVVESPVYFRARRHRSLPTGESGQQRALLVLRFPHTRLVTDRRRRELRVDESYVALDRHPWAARKAHNIIFHSMTCARGVRYGTGCA